MVSGHGMQPYYEAMEGTPGHGLWSRRVIIWNPGVQLAYDCIQLHSTCQWPRNSSGMGRDFNVHYEPLLCSMVCDLKGMR